MIVSNLRGSDYNYGFDAQKAIYCDMIQAGIIDPAKVIRIALEDAASIAGLMITTEAMIADREDPKQHHPQMTTVQM